MKRLGTIVPLAVATLLAAACGRGAEGVPDAEMVGGSGTVQDTAGAGYIDAATGATGGTPIQGGDTAVLPADTATPR